MKIIVAGATGFIGRSLVPVLVQNGYSVTVISRDITKAKKIYPSLEIVSWEKLNTLSADTFTAVINLTGENIASARWTNARKNILLNSRIEPTQKLVQWLNQTAETKPHLYNASAIGVYPAGAVIETQPYTEKSTLPNSTHGFAEELVRKWEASTQTAHVPVTLMRFAVVLKRKEGLLNKLEWPFALGLGSILGRGEQAFSWIHIDDLVNAIVFLLKKPEIVGVVNLCAPECVTQKVFARTFARVIHRPLLLTMPAWVVEMLFGQMGVELLLSGQNVRPERLGELEFKFNFPNLEGALGREFNC